jgi:hypothetical protein
VVTVQDTTTRARTRAPGEKVEYSKPVCIIESSGPTQSGTIVPTTDANCMAGGECREQAYARRSPRKAPPGPPAF